MIPRIPSLLILGLGAFAGDADAGPTGDSVTYEIHVVDEVAPNLGRDGLGHGRRVLSNHPSARGPCPPGQALQCRCRFHLLGDLIGDEWVLRTAPDGSVKYERPDKVVHGLARVRTSFAGLKRGFHSAQVDDDAPINTRRNIVIRLQRDLTAVVDPRMEEFDRIRAFANPGNDVEDPMATHRVLRSQDDARLRASSPPGWKKTGAWMTRQLSTSTSRICRRSRLRS